ncbi:DUF943 family protein [Kalamiella sp. sgz302252]|uniref:DUF943 family protein n=1 Tax=Pantoea sp. sgz302252 TaxID=3341827 RepID=UPI0036D2E117
MKKVKKIFPALVVLSWLYVVFIMLQPVEIVAVHQNNILVRHFPLTDKGKISWWKRNRVAIKEKFGLPEEYEDSGTKMVYIWDFGKGYEIEKPDETTFFPSDDTDHLRCFEEIKAAERCIRKENLLMFLGRSSTGITRYRTGGLVYYQKTGGPLILEKRVFDAH